MLLTKKERKKERKKSPENNTPSPYRERGKYQMTTNRKQGDVYDSSRLGRTESVIIAKTVDG